MNYEHIPAEKFRFVQDNERLHDTELKTKARGFFADALLRFSKNKSSVIAAYILLFLILYSILAPLLSPYIMHDHGDAYRKEQHRHNDTDRQQLPVRPYR